MIQTAVLPNICESRGLNHSGKPNSELFSSVEGVERAVDAPQRISLSDLEASQNLKETSLEAPSSTKPSPTAE
jgi:hypothetical protein